MHKLWTQYRASLLETGNRTEEPLEPPPCYAVMCDVWGHRAGMGSTVFYSSDRHRAEAARSSQAQRARVLGHDAETRGGLDETAEETSTQDPLEEEASETTGEIQPNWRRTFVNEQESDEEKAEEEDSVHEETTASDQDQEHGSRQGWRTHSGVKRKGQTSVAAGILAVSNSLADIAAAFKSARTQENREAYSLRPDERGQVMQSLQDLTQSVRAQTEVLTQLVRLVSGGASLPQDASSAVCHQSDDEEETQISL